MAKDQKRRRKVANESTIWATEPDQRFMTWWKKELDETNLQKSHMKKQRKLRKGFE
jgi:hypothetical protein